jgi:hypothetical protein
MANAGDTDDERAVYSPPCVVKISDLNRGEGQQAQQRCYPAGSGDTVECAVGNYATPTCLMVGNSANGFCHENGSGASGYCTDDGSSGDIFHP